MSAVPSPLAPDNWVVTSNHPYSPNFGVAAPANQPKFFTRLVSRPLKRVPEKKNLSTTFGMKYSENYTAFVLAAVGVKRDPRDSCGKCQSCGGQWAGCVVPDAGDDGFLSSHGFCCANCLYQKEKLRCTLYRAPETGAAAGMRASSPVSSRFSLPDNFLAPSECPEEEDALFNLGKTLLQSPEVVQLWLIIVGLYSLGDAPTPAVGNHGTQLPGRICGREMGGGNLQWVQRHSPLSWDGPLPPGGAGARPRLSRGLCLEKQPRPIWRCQLGSSDWSRPVRAGVKQCGMGLQHGVQPTLAAPGSSGMRSSACLPSLKSRSGKWNMDASSYQISMILVYILISCGRGGPSRFFFAGRGSSEGLSEVGSGSARNATVHGRARNQHSPASRGCGCT